MPKMIFVNLPVADVDKAVAFYEAIGFTKDMRFTNPGVAAAMVWSDTISFMLLSREFYLSFIPGRSIPAPGENEVQLCLSCDSRADVDAMVETAIAAGSKGDINPVDDHGFMYGRSFEDLDGHVFGPMWMDVDAFLKAQQQPATANA